MTISIHSEDVRLFLKFPTGLLLNRITASVAVKALKKKDINIGLSPQDVKELASCIRFCKRRYRKMELVRVESANGDKVVIKL